MRHFQSKQSQKACDDWFRKHITTKKQVPDPGPSRDDSYSGPSGSAERIPSLPTGTRSAAKHDESHGFGGPPARFGRRGPQPERFFFSNSSDRGSTGHVDETLKSKQGEGRSLDENVWEAPTNDFGPIILDNDNEMPPMQNKCLIVQPTVKYKSCSFGGWRDHDPELRTQYSVDEDVPQPPIYTSSHRMDDVVPCALRMPEEKRYVMDKPVLVRRMDNGQSDNEAKLRTQYEHLVVLPTVTNKSCSFGGRRDHKAELRTRNYWDENAILSPTDRVRVCRFGGQRDRDPTAGLRSMSGVGDHVPVRSTDTYDPMSFGGLRDREAEEAESKEKHVKEDFNSGLGTVSFVGMGDKEAKFARLRSNTLPEQLYEILTTPWELSPPNLLISVAGGAKKFDLKPHLKNMFHRGLMKVTQTTGAWILTEGINTGVAKHVGQAVSSCESGHIVAIGVAAWSVIHNRHMLVNPENTFCQAKYVANTEAQGQCQRCLDHNHTHFLLVDDTRGQRGTEIKLRARLEKYISEKELANQVSGVKIPVVFVVLNGDADTLNTMYRAMKDGIPCVVLEGSGGMADVVADVAERPMQHVTIEHINDLMYKFFVQDSSGFSYINILECTKKIQDLLRMPHLLTVFRVSADGDGDVDVAILKALLKASRSREGSESYQGQLELAVAWNRVDIAKTEIFTDESKWKPEQLHSAMFSALVGNKPEYVSLLLENGVSLMDFLQKDTLYDLYKKLPNCLFLRRLAKRKRSRPVALIDQTTFINRASHEARHLLKSFTLPILPPQPVDLEEVEMSPASVSENFLQSGSPERDLFLWAILHCNNEIAEIAWKECPDCMASALAASKMLKKLGRDVYREEDTEEAKRLKELANLYETRAIDVFSECCSCDEERAQKLLLRKSPLWDGATSLSLALEANNQNFIAQSGVQALLTQIWCGELSVETPVWRVMACIIFFPLIYTPFLDFRRDEEIQREAEKKEVAKALETITKQSHEEELKEKEKQLEPLCGCARLRALYSSLQVKFYLHIVSYFVFLMLFAVVLMVDFHPLPSVLEILLYVWTFSLACEEIRQLFYDPNGLGCQKKAKLYIYDLWNVLDVLSVILFIIGVALRFNDGVIYAGKIVLCIDFIIFCLRLMAIFIVNRTLGPKIIIVRRMMRDMFFFMFLLSIWVVAYGVAKHGILIHNEDRLGWILRGAVYEPYLTLFGDVPSNIDHTQFDISSCSMNGRDPLKPRCPVLNENEMPAFPEWLTIIMTCVYLLFANILLLNLLIAILSFTFQVVQDNTDRIWKFQRYELIYEYHSRPVAPPPFILLCHLYKLLRALLRRLQKACTNSRESRHVLRQSQEESSHGEEDEKLLHWEALRKDQFLASTKQALIQSSEQRIQDTALKVSSICDRLDREEAPGFSSVDLRLARLEEQVMQVIQLVSAQGRNFDNEEPVVADTAQSWSMAFPAEFTDSQIIPMDTVEGFHVRARHSPYAGGTVRRFPVPEEKVPWNVYFRSYDPPYYSSPDTEDDVDRSEFGNFVNTSNPGGRTGLCGRGVLRRLGPNRSLDLILTRWRDRAYLEFLAHKGDNDESLILPGGEVESAGDFPAVLETTMGKEVCQKIKEMTTIFVVHKDYVDDQRNTDDAWVETTVLTLDLTDSPLLTDISALVTQSQGSERPFEWHEVSGRTRLNEHQREYLETVAQWHSGRF